LDHDALDFRACDSETLTVLASQKLTNSILSMFAQVAAWQGN
jgi:hypothetical protein